MSDETKIAKFEVLLKEVKAWLCYTPSLFVGLVAENDDFIFNVGGNYRKYRLSIFDMYKSNPYVATLLNNAGAGGKSSGPKLTDDVTYLCKDYRSSNEGDQKSRNSLIFWMLFLAALDDKIYNNELDSIIDIAYVMNFNAAMIRDWCRAVECIMQGNRFYKGDVFECETQEGKEFFLHEYTSEESISGLGAGVDSVIAQAFRATRR